jgi:plastocyanin
MKLTPGARVLLLGAALLAPILLAACGGGGYGGGSKSSGTTAVTAAAATGGSGAGHTVTADETEYRIVLSSSTVAPGSYRIVAANKGTITHVLEIDGPGIVGVKTGDIAPGSSASLSVKLVKGSYDVYCPLPGHKALGMNTTLVVS